MRLGNVPQPFPYQGSKRKLAPIIVECIPRGTKRLIEPFAGSAAISVAVAWVGKVDSFVLNDAHSPLIALWARIIDDPIGLANDYQRIWDDQRGREPEFYNTVRDLFNQQHRPEHLLFLLARCVKAAIRYNRNGQFNNSPDHRRLGMRPATMRASIGLVSKALAGRTVLMSEDYSVVLQQAKPTDLVYMDPPYQGVCKKRDNRYVDGVEFEQFVEQLAALNKRGIPYIVSYDGRTGDTAYGQKLPESLGLFHTEILVGRSTQATLLGRDDNTYEALYLSPATVRKLGALPPALQPQTPVPMLFG